MGQNREGERGRGRNAQRLCGRRRAELKRPDVARRGWQRRSQNRDGPYQERGCRTHGGVYRTSHQPESGCIQDPARSADDHRRQDGTRTAWPVDPAGEIIEAPENRLRSGRDREMPHGPARQTDQPPGTHEDERTGEGGPNDRRDCGGLHDPARSVHGHSGHEGHYRQRRRVDDALEHDRTECFDRIQVLAACHQIGANWLAETRRQDRVPQIPD